MKLRTSVLLLVTLLIGATMCFAADPNLGTWKLNEGKSKIAAGLPKNTTVTYDAAGDGIKATVEGVDGQGKPTHTSGRASTTAKTIRSQATRLPIRGRSRRSTTVRWS
jgi:hypothetical protein